MPLSICFKEEEKKVCRRLIYRSTSTTEELFPLLSMPEMIRYYQGNLTQIESSSRFNQHVQLETPFKLQKRKGWQTSSTLYTHKYDPPSGYLHGIKS